MADRAREPAFSDDHDELADANGHTALMALAGVLGRQAARAWLTGQDRQHGVGDRHDNGSEDA
jgi:hypothetical protein